MPGVVTDAEKHLVKNGIKAETFVDDFAWKKFKQTQKDYNDLKGLSEDTYLPHNEVFKTAIYKSNKKWAQKLKMKVIL